jgi:hypothetical protein
MEAAGVCFFQLILLAAAGTACAIIASKKGRTPVGWFFLGFFFPLLGIILVAVLPSPKQQQAEREFTERERRRLREQLRQERIKTEAFRQFASARIDVHDDRLGIDTRNPEALPGFQGMVPQLEAESDALRALEQQGGGQQLPPDASGTNVQPLVTRPPIQPGPPPPPGAAVPAMFATWYYESMGQSVGPVSEMEIKTLLRFKKIGPETLLWCEDLVQWTPAKDVEAFRHVVNP